MKRIRKFAVLFAISLGFGPIIAAEKAVPPPARTFSHWAGSWKLSMEVNRLLGFSDERSRENASFDHPLSFKLSFDKEIGKNMGSEEFELYRKDVFEKIGHEVVATGKWETKFEVEPGIDTDSFVTQHDGRTYLFVGAPYAVLYGGEITFIEGSEEKRDLMVINLNTMGTGRVADCVVYKRAE